MVTHPITKWLLHALLSFTLLTISFTAYAEGGGDGGGGGGGDHSGHDSFRVPHHNRFHEQLIREHKQAKEHEKLLNPKHKAEVVHEIHQPRLPFTCIDNAGIPAIVRTEGILEMVDQLLVPKCTSSINGSWPTMPGFIPFPSLNDSVLNTPGLITIPTFMPMPGSLTTPYFPRIISNHFSDTPLLIDEPQTPSVGLIVKDSLKEIIERINADCSANSGSTVIIRFDESGGCNASTMGGGATFPGFIHFPSLTTNVLNSNGIITLPTFANTQGLITLPYYSPIVPGSLADIPIIIPSTIIPAEQSIWSLTDNSFKPVVWTGIPIPPPNPHYTKKEMEAIRKAIKAKKMAEEEKYPVM